MISYRSTSGANFNLIKSILSNRNLFFKTLVKLNSDLSQNYSNIDVQRQRMQIDLNNYLPDNVLSVVDKMSMSSSIEVRTPFLDHRLVDEVYNVDFGKFMRLESKEILKTIYKSKIKTDLWSRNKNGFNFPINLWLQNNKKYIIQSVIEEKNEIFNNILDKKKFLKILSKKNVKHNFGQTIFSIFILAKWFKYRYERNR